MQLRELYQELQDFLTYVKAYAPEFPGTGMTVPWSGQEQSGLDSAGRDS